MGAPVLRSVLLILTAALGFGLVAQGMSRLIPMPNFLGHWSKWEYYRHHRHGLDALWIGTSHIARDVDNPTIQARLAGRGMHLEMFNFGIPGMNAYEQDYMLQRILALGSRRLKYVFIEGGPIAMGVHPRHIFRSPDDNDTHRSAMWHTPRQTAKVLDQVWLLPLPWVDRLDHAYQHLRIMGRNLSSYGLGREIRRGLRGVRIDHPWLEETGGFRTWADTHPDQPVHSHEFARLAAELGEEALLTLIPPDRLATHTDLSGLNLDFYRQQYAAAKAAGVTLIYVVMPGSTASSERPLLHREGVIPVLWNFNDPGRYPEFFRVRNRWDEEHLNADGIALMTDLLTEYLAAYLAGRDID